MPDAPVGYLASFKALCDKTGLKFDDFLGPDSSAEMHHFIGKDIINFHGLFWAGDAARRADARAHRAARQRLPDGERRQDVQVARHLHRCTDHLDAGIHPEFLRYNFATMLSAAPVDVDLDLKAFEERVNSHLIGKWVNIASRTAGFVQKFFDGKLADRFDTEEAALWQTMLSHYDGVDALYEAGEFAEVTRRFVTIADLMVTSPPGRRG
ncbi:Methionine--tRNA ligase OS=Rhodanobacter lindaniclasticus OX=75310 GN=metG PE=3 SV=1 [Rhodanobacter lindaniclasticus]